jgi:hypothetical protein
MFLTLLGLMVLIPLAAAAFFFFRNLEFEAPTIDVTKSVPIMGKHSDLAFTAKDRKTGLRQVSVTVEQNGAQKTLYSETFPGPRKFEIWKRGTVKEKPVQLSIDAKELGLKEGPAKITIEAFDHSYRSSKGNRAVYEQPITIDLTPPRVEALSKQHYINQGGASCVVYRVSSDTVSSGVRVGDRVFPGFPVGAKDPNVRMAFFAVLYYMPLNVDIRLVARDAAGNEGYGRFYYKLFPRKFPHGKINVSDEFLQKTIPEMFDANPALPRDPDLLKDFLYVNGTLREENRKKIQQVCQQTQPQLLWQEPFRQMSNSKVESPFAQYRTYVYKNKEVDQQVHLGYDLAVTMQTPILAANDGVVVYSDDLGIFGQSVILDHGCGLFTLYSHMSSRQVKPGDKVKKGDSLGRTGSTGLAQGDHLHFTMLLDGFEIDSKEWWDPKWIREKVFDKLHEAQVQ